MDNAELTAVEFLRAWAGGEFDRARDYLAEDATFVGPLGATAGADAYIAGVRGFAEVVDRVDVHKTVTEGDDVCVVYDLVTNAGTIPTVGLYDMHGGKVHSVRAYFDPRPLVS